MIMLSQIGIPAMAAMTAIVPERAMTDPMERSIPAVRIAKVSPIPMMVIALVCSARERTLRMVKKFLAVIEKTINNAAIAMYRMNAPAARPRFEGICLVRDKSSLVMGSVVISLMVVYSLI